MEEQKQRKKLSLGLRLFIILMAVTLLLCATVFGIWLHGRSVLRSKTVKAPAIDQSDDTQLDSYTIYRDGKYYRYKDGMVNLLLMGVDADEKFDQPQAFGGDYQADEILLAALDTVNDQMTLISVSRDTMCDITILEDDQHQQGVARAQIALSYAYGDGLSVSCELCREAVSTLFHGLEIDGYGAFFLGGVGKLNDAMGGVTVAVPQDLPGLAVFRGMTPGGTATLTGEQARAFIQWREETATGNDGRMQRQKLFLLGAIDQLRRQIKSNPASVLSLYNHRQRLHSHRPRPEPHRLSGHRGRLHAVFRRYPPRTHGGGRRQRPEPSGASGGRGGPERPDPVGFLRGIYTRRQLSHAPAPAVHTAGAFCALYTQMGRRFFCIFRIKLMQKPVK